MTPSLLTERAPPADTDCTKLGVVRPFTFTTAFPALPAAPAQGGDAPPRVAHPRTGTPIRATLPLPRRRAAPHHASRTRTRTRPPTAVACPDDSMDASPDHAPEGDGRADEYDSDDERVSARCCAYVSITAAEGLAAWSFEELRVECYAQSLIARGTRPQPVAQPSLAIPPAFIPRIVPRN